MLKRKFRDHLLKELGFDYNFTVKFIPFFGYVFKLFRLVYSIKCTDSSPVCFFFPVSAWPLLIVSCRSSKVYFYKWFLKS